MISSKESLQNPKSLKSVIEKADLSQKDLRGRTVLYEAMYCGHSPKFVQYLLSSGRIDIATRDYHGKTARDYAESLNSKDYVDAIDCHVLDVLNKRDVKTPRGWILKGYDHILDIIKRQNKKALDLRQKLENSRLMKPVNNFITEILKLEVLHIISIMYLISKNIVEVTLSFVSIQPMENGDDKVDLYRSISINFIVVNSNTAILQNR